MIKNKITYWITILVILASFGVQSQGLKKLQISDKYGTTGNTDPITPKSDIDLDTAGQPGTPGVDGAAPEGMSYFNGTDVEIKEMINQISALTGKQFIFDDKKIKGKITIIADKPMSREMIYQAFLSSLEINGLTTVMTPAGLINIIDQKDAINKPIDLFKNDSPNTDKYITRIIQPTNISAKEIVEVISKMVSKSGNVMPYPTTNSIIITDTGANIDHIMKLIHELDQEGPQEQLEMIPIIHADAKEVVKMLESIFEKKDAQGATTVRRKVPSRSGSEMEDVQSISKIIADERTNSILIMGTNRSIAKVKALIAQLDRSISGTDGRIHVYRLKFAKAKDVATVLSTLVGDSSAKSTSTKGKAAEATKSSGSVTLEGGVKVTADETTNSLIVVSSPKDYHTLVDNVIEKLDVVRPQVYLEAVIMSLNVNKSSSLGVSGFGGIINTLTNGEQLNGFGGIMPSSPTSISTIAGASGGFGGGVISSQTIDFTLSDGSTASIPAISGIITALASDTDANVLSTPSIMTLDNEAAKIQVGQEVPVQSGTTVSTGVTTFNVTREDVGIILEITPQISEYDTVRLKIKQEITSVFGTDPSLGPTLDKKTVETAVLAKNKQTIVIGGLIDDRATVTTHKVPLLGDIPVLGNLFRNRTTEKAKTNLLVFITPYIIRERRDYLVILKKKIEERNHFIDMNYGRSQQKFIRKAINDHATDLLEFKCNNQNDPDPCWSTPPTAYQTSYPTTNPQNSYQQATTTGSYSPPKKIKYR